MITASTCAQPQSVFATMKCCCIASLGMRSGPCRAGAWKPGKRRRTRSFANSPRRRERLWVLGVVAAGGGYRAMMHVVSDLLAVGVWHIGLFIVATGSHGDGTARALLHCLEEWAIANGATWLRLGVVVGNVRGERFWERCGFVASRRREGLVMGRQVDTIRNMAKPLAGGSLSGYLARVPRDDPRSP